MKKIRTDLDDKFHDALLLFADKMFEINQEAVKTGQDDIKGTSCYLCEIIDTIQGNLYPE